MLWRPQFNLPTYNTLPSTLRETVYFHDYQGVRLIVLNTNRMPEHQVHWLDQRLEENPNDWAIVSFHHPLFSSRENRDNKKIRDLWKPILDKHKVDLVLQGHDHTYARGHIPVSLNERTNDSVVQTMYVNSVSGPKMYEFMKTGWDVYKPEGVVLDRSAENGQFFQVLSIDGKSLTYKAYTANGFLYDAFRLDKDEKGQKHMSRLPVELEKEFRYTNTAPYKRKDPEPTAQ
jgi:3',5'-cyclic AMP phosphodiesterase CpdA